MKYSEICDRLTAAGICDAAFEASILIEKFCSVGRSALLLERERDFDSKALARAIDERCRRYPLQYIVGEWSFCNEIYQLSPDCLIPRPDTELLVERAAAAIKPYGHFIDLGTGSGCISISLLAMRPDLIGTAGDISTSALAVAQRNAIRNGVEDRIEFIGLDMLSDTLWESGVRFDAIISNPPYIPTSQLACLDPELSHEPSRALDGGDDGLIFYRKIIENAHKILAPDGVILFEFALDQSEDIEALATARGYNYTLYRDIENRPRACLLSRC